MTGSVTSETRGADEQLREEHPPPPSSDAAVARGAAAVENSEEAISPPPPPPTPGDELQPDYDKANSAPNKDDTEQDDARNMTAETTDGSSRESSEPSSPSLPSQPSSSHDFEQDILEEYYEYDEGEVSYYGDESSDGSFLYEEEGDVSVTEPEIVRHTSVIAIGIPDPRPTDNDQEEANSTWSTDEEDDKSPVPKPVQTDSDEHSIEDIVQEAVSHAVAEQVATEEFEDKNNRKEEEAIAAVSAYATLRPPATGHKSAPKTPQKSETAPTATHAATARTPSDSVAVVAQKGVKLPSTEDTDLEAQVGVPVSIPGAFAMDGMVAPPNGRQLTGYDSGFDDDDSRSDTQSTTHPEREDEEMNIIEGEVRETDDSRMLVDGLPVFDDEDEELLIQEGQKTNQMRRRFALLFASMLVVAGAIIAAVVLTSGQGGPSTVSPAVKDPEGWASLGSPLFGPDDNDNALFGHVVSLAGDGTRLVVGVPGWDQGTGVNRDLSVGQAQVFALDENSETYVPLGDAIIGPGIEAEAGRAVSMSRDGLRVAVASPKWQGGSVTIYQTPLSATEPWIPIGQTLVGNQGENGEFGFSVASSANGGVVVVGSPFVSSSAGIVRIYQEIDSEWMQMGGDLVGRDGDIAGYSVAVSDNGQIVAVGAIGSASDRPGQVRVYRYTNVDWEEIGPPIDGSTIQDRFGHSLSLSSDGFIVAVGASGGISAGQVVEVFQYSENSNSWEPLGSAVESTNPSDDFGFSVCLSASGADLAIGIPGKDESGEDSGQIEVFRLVGSSWVSQQSPILGTAEDDNLGHSVSISSDGRRVAGGAPKSNFDGKPNNVGKAVVYEVIVA